MLELTACYKMFQLSSYIKSTSFFSLNWNSFKNSEEIAGNDFN